MNDETPAQVEVGATAPTLEQVKQWRVRQEIHHNGGSEWFGYTFRCVEEPRLTRFDRYDRQTKGVSSTWRVDWIDQPSLEQAVEALAGPRAPCEHHWTKSLPRATSTTDHCILCTDVRPHEPKVEAADA